MADRHKACWFQSSLTLSSICVHFVNFMFISRPFLCSLDNWCACREEMWRWVCGVGARAAHVNCHNNSARAIVTPGQASRGVRGAPPMRGPPRAAGTCHIYSQLLLSGAGPSTSSSWCLGPAGHHSTSQTSIVCAVTRHCQKAEGTVTRPNIRHSCRFSENHHKVFLMTLSFNLILHLGIHFFRSFAAESCTSGLARHLLIHALQEVEVQPAQLS